MDLEESRFRATWKRFLEVLKVDHNCSLADVCRKQHTTLGDIEALWMSRRGPYSFKTQETFVPQVRNFCAT